MGSDERICQHMQSPTAVKSNTSWHSQSSGLTKHNTVTESIKIPQLTPSPFPKWSDGDIT